MLFEFDEAKSVANHLKHGIDFVQVQAIWEDVQLMRNDARSTTKRRYAYTGMLAGKLWTVIATQRKNRIRIISARRAWEKEIKEYYDD